MPDKNLEEVRAVDLQPRARRGGPLGGSWIDWLGHGIGTKRQMKRAGLGSIEPPGHAAHRRRTELARIERERAGEPPMAPRQWRGGSRRAEARQEAAMYGTIPGGKASPVAGGPGTDISDKDRAMHKAEALRIEARIGNVSGQQAEREELHDRLTFHRAQANRPLPGESGIPKTYHQLQRQMGRKWSPEAGKPGPVVRAKKIDTWQITGGYFPSKHTAWAVYDADGKQAGFLTKEATREGYSPTGRSYSTHSRAVTRWGWREMGDYGTDKEGREAYQFAESFSHNPMALKDALTYAQKHRESVASAYQRGVESGQKGEPPPKYRGEYPESKAFRRGYKSAVPGKASPAAGDDRIKEHVRALAGMSPARATLYLSGLSKKDRAAVIALGRETERQAQLRGKGSPSAGLDTPVTDLGRTPHDEAFMKKWKQALPSGVTHEPGGVNDTPRQIVDRAERDLASARKVLKDIQDTPYRSPMEMFEKQRKVAEFEEYVQHHEDKVAGLRSKFGVPANVPGSGKQSSLYSLRRNKERLGPKLARAEGSSREALLKKVREIDARIAEKQAQGHGRWPQGALASPEAGKQSLPAGQEAYEQLKATAAALGLPWDDPKMRQAMGVDDPATKPVPLPKLKGASPTPAGSVTQANAPGSLLSGRGPTGKLRNFKSMSDGKLLTVYDQLQAEDNDPEAIAAVTAEWEGRFGAAPSPGPHLPIVQPPQTNTVYATSFQSGRGPSGKLRNFKAMSDSKFDDVYDQVVHQEGNDPEAIAVLKDEWEKRHPAPPRPIPPPTPLPPPVPKPVSATPKGMATTAMSTMASAAIKGDTTAMLQLEDLPVDSFAMLSPGQLTALGDKAENENYHGLADKAREALKAKRGSGMVGGLGVATGIYTPDVGPVSASSAASIGSVSGKRVVVTGKLATGTRTSIHGKISMAGGKPQPSITNATDLLVVGDAPGSKLAKAQAMGIPVITEQELMKLLESLSPRRARLAQRVGELLEAGWA